MKNVKTHILINDPAIQPHACLVEKEAAAAIQIITQYIPVTDVDIIIMHSPKDIAFGIVSGVTQYKNRIIIALKTNHKQFKKLFRAELQKTLAYNLYQITRIQKNSYAKTLIEDIIDAGLAIHFEIEVASNTRNPYWTSIKNNTLTKLIARAKKEFYSTNYDYHEWFYGSKAHNIPPFAGYCIGYNLIKKFLETNPSTKASKLILKKSKFLLAKITL